MKQLVITSNSYEETQLIGKRLAGCLKPGVKVLMSGTLGAGKTALTRGICSCFGLEDYVTSPTFSLMNIYEGKQGVTVVHTDAYRLDAVDDLYDIGFYDCGDTAISIVEWADNVFDSVPDEAGFVGIHIDKAADNEEKRVITLKIPHDEEKNFEDFVF